MISLDDTTGEPPPQCDECGRHSWALHSMPGLRSEWCPGCYREMVGRCRDCHDATLRSEMDDAGLCAYCANLADPEPMPSAQDLMNLVAASMGPRVEAGK